ncbi:MAG: hypothetical protein D6812_14560 [Deltaproteobacteria bacterium]|nr:MAG: hypothetical protein D6812_14560 [Deltaproteobacteria bacterium]
MNERPESWETTMALRGNPPNRRGNQPESQWESVRTPVAVIETHSLATRVLIAFLAVEVLLFLFDAFFNYGRWLPRSSRKIFNICRESSLGTWFMTMQAFLVGVTAGAVFFITRLRRFPWKRSLGWLLFALFFTYMSVDDTAEIHERIGSDAKRYLQAEKEGKKEHTSGKTARSNRSRRDKGAMGGKEKASQASAEAREGLGARLLRNFPTYYWQLVFGPIFGVMGIYIAFFLWRALTPLGLRKWIFVALGCWGIAVVLDALEVGQTGAELYETIMTRFEVGRYTVSHFSKMIEETLEMVGMTIFLYLFLRYFSFIAHGVELHLRSGQERALLPILEGIRRRDAGLKFSLDEPAVVFAPGSDRPVERKRVEMPVPSPSTPLGIDEEESEITQ